MVDGTQRASGRFRTRRVVIDVVQARVLETRFHRT